MTRTERSQLFQVYNVARGMGWDKARLNRALGIVQSRKRGGGYLTTPNFCDCDDKRFHLVPACKHQLAAALREVAGL